MPAFPTPRSIRARLIVLAATAVGASTLVGGALSLWQEAGRYATLKRDTLYSSAQVLASAAARGVAEGDTRRVYEAVNAVAKLDSITYVGVRDASGRVLADIGSTEQLVGDLVLDDPRKSVSIIALLTSHSLEVSVPVVQDGQTIGQLTMMAGTSDLAPRLRDTLVVTLTGSFAALLLGLLVALRMQGGITRPLRDLTGAMARVGEGHDYSVNVPVSQTAEIGLLANGFNAMLTDIRARDEKLAEHREHLEDEVAQRTVDLVAARDAAEDANAQKSQFLATMSHEIRTPMNGMLVMAELLASSDLPARSRRYAEVVSRSGQSLLAIINDILDFSKIEAGKLELEKLAVDPAECAETVVNLFIERARSKGLDLTARIDLDVPEWIEADPVRLGQVLGNLVNNALKFTEKGGVELRVESRVKSDQPRNGGVRFSVRDTGIGIAADKLKTVFEVFSQADQSTTRRYGGTGLGLSICQRLVEAMGAEIEATSELGKGSTFAFTLPRGGADAPAISSRAVHFGETAPRACIYLRAPFVAQTIAYYAHEFGYSLRNNSAPDAQEIAAATLVIADASVLEEHGASRHDRSSFVVALAEIGETSAEQCLAKGLADMALPSPVARADILDILRCLANGQKPSLASQIATRAAEQNFTGARVLVADDSAVNREVAIEALGRFGVTPDVVEDGLEAVSACAAQAYDLVLMDGSMPGLDGFEATKRIRAAELAGGRRTPIVALTAHVVGAGAELWKEVGMDGVLHKPFTIARLAEVLAAHLRPAGAAVAAAPIRETVLDAAALDNLRQQQHSGFAARVIALYRKHAPQSLQEIARQAANGDHASLASAAHALKSMSLSIGAALVAARAGEIETLARLEHLLPDAARLAALEQDVMEACAALDALPMAA